MPTPPPRKRFQIHLSTAVVMMFVAAGLIWANIYERRHNALGTADHGYGMLSEFFSKGKAQEWRGDIFVEHGWPFTVRMVGSYIITNREGRLLKSEQHGTALWIERAIVFDALI